MSNCSGHHAFKSIRGLSQIRSSPASSTAARLKQRRDPNLPPRILLPFLYPRWLQHELARQYHTGPRPGPGLQSSNRRAKGHGRKCAGQSAVLLIGRRQLSGSPVQGDHKHDANRGTRSAYPEHPDFIRPSSVPEHPGESSMPPSHESVHDANQPVNHLGVWVHAGDVGSRAGHWHSRHLETSPLQLHQGTIRSAPHKSTSQAFHPRPLIRRIVVQKGSERRSSEAYYRTHRINTDYLFRQLQAALLRSSDEGDEITRLVLPADFLRKTAGTAHHNMWIHSEGTGCTVSVVSFPNRDHCDVVLRGSERARDIACSSLTAHHSNGWNDHPKDKAWRLQLLQFQEHDNIAGLPYPPQWSLRNFLAYVDTLTSQNPQAGFARQAYSKRLPKVRVIGQMLESLFKNPSARPYASVAALRKALRYCRAYPLLSDTARRLWESAIEIGLSPDVSCFHNELFRCLKVKDIKRFTDLVSQMDRFHVQPNHKIFALVLKFTEDATLRNKIYEFVKKSWPNVDGEGEADVILASTKREIDAFIRAPDGMALFLEYMEKLHGPSWLSPRVVRQMLRSCRLSTARTLQASEILAIVQYSEQKIPLDQACTEELLLIAKKAANIEDAVAVATSAPVQRLSSMPQQMLEALFLLSWRTRRYNLCRLLWFQAAALGRITWDMRKLVKLALVKNTSDQPKQAQRIWELLAAKLIIGAAGDCAIPAHVLPHLSKTEMWPSLPSCLLHFVENGPMRHEQIQLAQLLLERDLNAFLLYQPIDQQHFLELLGDALARDKEWDASNVAAAIAPLRLLKQLFQVPLIPRTGKTEYPSDPTRRWFLVNGHRYNLHTMKCEDLCAGNDTVKHVDGTFPVYRPSWKLSELAQFTPHEAPTGRGSNQVESEQQEALPRQECDQFVPVRDGQNHPGSSTPAVRLHSSSG